MLGDKIRCIRKEKKMSINALSKSSGVSLGYLSDLENNKSLNPTMETLDKLAGALGITTKELLTGIEDNKRELIDTPTFETAEAAMKFILEQPAIMGFGGFDIKEMSDTEVVEFANELLRQLQLISYKYKR